MRAEHDNDASMSRFYRSLGSTKVRQITVQIGVLSTLLPWYREHQQR
jgi:hypothetical protein